MAGILKNSDTGSASERRFYNRSKAFGRFGMRIFEPQIMAEPHWHGHVETNLIRHAKMYYQIDNTPIVIEPDHLIIFWANVPHQLVKIEKTTDAAPELFNVYLPLDSFLMMPYLAELQFALLNGGMIVCPKDLCGPEQLKRWYDDYRSGKPDRLELIKMEMNLLFRRLSVVGPVYLRQPWLDQKTAAHNLSSSHIRHVVAMVRHILENLSEPLRNEHVTAVTGLHPNYALAIFTRAMNIPLKQFILRMRLLRARGLLLESDVAIAKVATDSGFSSTSQFYAHFSSAYGISPSKLRDKFHPN